MYLHEHNKPMSTPAAAQMLSIVMYNRRFFPYYVSNILAGLDNEGKGVVYSYDPIGNMECSMFKATGNSGHLLQSLLDNQVRKCSKKTCPSSFAEYNHKRQCFTNTPRFVHIYFLFNLGAKGRNYTVNKIVHPLQTRKQNNNQIDRLLLLV